MWRIENGIIKLLLEDGSEYIPSVEELYSAVQGMLFVVNGKNYESPTTALAVSFSPYGVSLAVKFVSVNGRITFKLIASDCNCESEIPIGPRGEPLKYVIIDSVWHYINADECEIVESMLRRQEAKLGRTITICQYIGLLAEARENGIATVDCFGVELDDFKRSSHKKFCSTLLKADLYSYQDAGCNWMEFMVRNGCGFVLGDEMGLGKTLQIIALICKLRELKEVHFLIVVPVSLIVNWAREIGKFAPTLRYCIHRGSDRIGYYKDFLRYDIIITTYNGAVADQSILEMVRWDGVVLDEAQNIKTPDSKRTRAVKRLSRDVGIAVTGTPFENHMTDIWSIIDFVQPNFLGPLPAFEEKFGDSLRSAQSVEPYLSPIMLRRSVDEVAKDLPDRVVIPQPIEMMTTEAKRYDEERCKILAENGGSMLAAIQRLRMFCTHPFVYSGEGDIRDPALFCSKYDRLVEILEEIFARGEKALVFTSFNKMISLVCDDIKRRFGVPTEFINGAVQGDGRQRKIDAFSAHSGAGLLVLNPKAAGVGLNITCANHVIHYNLEWNPAVEDQATARAYRRGQTRTVFVHRLYNQGTIEELMNDRLSSKRQLFDAAVHGTDGLNCSNEDLARILSKSPMGE